MSSMRTASLLTGNSAAISLHDLLRCISCCSRPLDPDPGCGVLRLHSGDTNKGSAWLGPAMLHCIAKQPYQLRLFHLQSRPNRQNTESPSTPTHVLVAHTYPLESRIGSEELLRSDDMCEEPPWLPWAFCSWITPAQPATPSPTPLPPDPQACCWCCCCDAAPGPDEILPAAAAADVAATEADWKGLLMVSCWALPPCRLLAAAAA